MPKVTVVTAAWLDTEDKVAWLEEAGRSVMRQDIEDLEWIVVDDASPLLPPKFDDPRVRVVRASHRQGPSMCRNTAANLGTADAILALDADDVLASPDVLSRLWDAWMRRPDRFYYGNLQIYQGGVPGKVVQFPPYNFLQTLDPKGLIPVTGLVSKEAWFKAGGWKRELNLGLEDVEFWISVGKAGFCGFKLDITTILYRRHPTSRAADMRAGTAEKEKAMREMIARMHEDLYKGVLPMGCCGGGRKSSGTTGPLPISSPTPRTLAGDDLPGGKVWVRYNGARTGEFGIRGQMTGATYLVSGAGAEFQIHAQDAQYFRNQGRGKDFSVGIAPPAPPEPAEPVVVQVEQGYTPPSPVLAEIVSLGPVPEPAPLPVVERPVPQIVSVASIEPETFAFDEPPRTSDHPLEALVVDSIPERLLNDIKAMLELEGWTVPQLARATADSLTPYPGLGKKRAEALIEAARKLWQP